MVHGAFCGGWAFDAFRAPFEAVGHAVSAPHLRGHAPEDGRYATAGVSVADYAADIAKLIEAQPAPPVLIGHSLGGLVIQMAAQKLRGTAPIAGLILLAPSAPWGVQGATMEEAISAMSLYALGPYWLQAVEPDRGVAKHYSLDRMPPAEAEALSRRMIPESGRALFETLNWWLDPLMTIAVDGSRIDAPALVLAGGSDLVNPASTVRQTATRLKAPCTVYPGMSHWLIGEPGWEAVALDCLKWIDAL